MYAPHKIFQSIDLEVLLMSFNSRNYGNSKEKQLLSHYFF